MSGALINDCYPQELGMSHLLGVVSNGQRMDIEKRWSTVSTSHNRTFCSTTTDPFNQNEGSLGLTSAIIFFFFPLLSSSYGGSLEIQASNRPVYDRSRLLIESLEKLRRNRAIVLFYFFFLLLKLLEKLYNSYLE